MKYYAIILVGGILFASCQNSDNAVDTVKIEGIDAEIPEADVFNYDTLQGMYMGDFAGDNIRLILNYVSKTNVVGYNIHKGLQRNLSGKVKRSGDSVMVYMAEPGDHKYDGVFELLFIGENSEPKGTWKSNSGEIRDVAFTLKKIVLSDDEDFDMEDDITEGNLHKFFEDAQDTLGDYSFKRDGLVIFSYYPGGYWDDDAKSRDKKQMKEIQGTWSMEGNKVSIAWEENKVFPQRTMTYEARGGEYDKELYRKDNSIYMRFYP